jgi:hypothetical protein
LIVLNGLNEAKRLNDWNTGNQALKLAIAVYGGTDGPHENRAFARSPRSTDGGESSVHDALKRNRAAAESPSMEGDL